MSNVIQLASRKVDLFERNLARFEELKPKSFSDTLSLAEEMEFDKIYNWLQVHKENKKQVRMAN